MLPRDGAVIGIDLAEDKQALAVIDHDVRVLARKTVRVKAFRLGAALDWAVGQARAKGFAQRDGGVRADRAAVAAGAAAVRGAGPAAGVHPAADLPYRPRAAGLTRAHKSDESDCVMIARLAVELHCYVPEELDETWAHLRHLGRRRAQLITAATASAQRIRDFLSVAWPAGARDLRPAAGIGDLAGGAAGSDGPVRRGSGQAGGDRGNRNSPPWSAARSPGGAASRRTARSAAGSSPR